MKKTTETAHGAATTAPQCDIASLRERMAALMSEFDVPLPEGDAGIVEAARRLHEMQKRDKALYDEFPEITMEIEADEIIPKRDALEHRFEDVLTDSEPQTLAGAATMLRYLLGSGEDLLNGADKPIANVLALVERLAAGGAG